MSAEIDLLLDRRRLKQRLIFWRTASIVLLLAAVLLAIGRSGLLPGPAKRAHVAVLSVDGVITDDMARDARVSKLASDPTVKAVIIAINSPGGSVAGGEALHDAIARVAATKPVVAVMGPVAASAAYMIAVPAARIFASRATLTGSIGVLLETGEISGLLRKLGITPETIVSGPLKDQPSFTAPITSAGRAVLQGIVNDLYEQFVGMVASGRHMSIAAVKALADGRPYTGQQAVKLGLIDAIGGMRQARAWLAAARGVSAKLPAVGVTGPEFAWPSFSHAFGEMLKIVLSQRVNLDGPEALWQSSEQLR